MIRLFAHANYDFLGVRRVAYVVTGVVAFVGLVALLIRGVNYSIDFTGGTLIELEANDAAISDASLRAALEGGGIPESEIQTFGGPNQWVIRARLGEAPDTAGEATQRTAAAVDSALTRAFGAGTYTIVRTEAVGPKVGGELRRKALTAILLSFLGTLVYLAFRFEWRFGIGAVGATAHDILLTVSFIALADIEVSLVVVAAILTIVGYSLNDTIVVFDRVRENLRKYRRQHMQEILNVSVNETLPRTVMTGSTTLLATLALLVFGPTSIQGFAAVMTFGLVTGTFSSIYIASPILLAIERKWPGEDARGARALPPRVPVPGGQPAS
jgi:preprotein translocase subunit SecF